MAISAIIGITYRQLFRYEASKVGSGIAWGLIYQLVWWFVGVLTLFPTFLSAPLAWTTADMAAALPSLVGHLAYGGVTSGTFGLLKYRHQAWAELDPRIESEESKRRRQGGTPATAVWVFILGSSLVLLTTLLLH